MMSEYLKNMVCRKLRSAEITLKIAHNLFLHEIIRAQLFKTLIAFVLLRFYGPVIPMGSGPNHTFTGQA